VRAALLLVRDAGPEDDERRQVARALLDGLAESVFESAVSPLHFLPAKEVDAVIAAHGSDRQTIAPFQRFVSEKSPCQQLSVDQSTLDYEQWQKDRNEDDSFVTKPDPESETETCELCYQPEGECQCGGDDY
jgi:hypothetical protein